MSAGTPGEDSVVGAINELSSKSRHTIPPELAKLDRAGFQEYMLTTIRESVFSGFETSPEIAAMTLRRELAGRLWDITIERLLYADTDEPDQLRRLHRDDLRDGCTATEWYTWVAQVATVAVDEARFDDWDRPQGDAVFGTPAEAYADAKAYLDANGARLAAPLDEEGDDAAA